MPTFKPLLISLLLLFSIQTSAQKSFELEDGRGYEECASCEKIMEEMPNEVSMGIHIHGDGSINFVTNSKLWFRRLFNEPKMGVAVELVSRSLYGCGKNLPEKDLTRGFVTKPVYRDELIKHADTIGKHISIRVGTVPAHLRKEILEGNLIFVNSDNYCSQHRVVNIEQDVLDLLPMGLYTDTLLQQDFAEEANNDKVFMFTTMKTITIPFRKGTAAFLPADLEQLRDSLKGYSIRRMEIRAYSSVDGPEEVNFKLMQNRGLAVQKAINSLGHKVTYYKLLPVENWIECYHDVPRLANMSKKQIKNLLQDKTEQVALDPILARHRKAVVNVWLDTPTRLDTMNNEALVPTFRKLVAEKNITDSRKVIKDSALSSHLRLLTKRATRWRNSLLLTDAWILP